MFAGDGQMKITTDFKVNLKNKEVQGKVIKASRASLVNVVVAIANDAIKGSPIITGHNRRSIAYKVGNKAVRKGSPRGDEKPFSNWQPQLTELQGAIYSTSGYGGYLETGTRFMAAQPYFKPALDKNIKKLPEGIKAELT